jgi:hypothetical protein
MRLPLTKASSTFALRSWGDNDASATTASAEHLGYGQGH